MNKHKNLKLIDTIENLSWRKYQFYIEKLYTTDDNEYMIETIWKLNPKFYEDEIKLGVLGKEDLLPQAKFHVISREEASVWLDFLDKDKRL